MLSHSLIRPGLLVLLQTLVFAMIASGFTPSAFADEETPAPATYHRQIVHDGGLTYYIVGPRAPHLFMVSRDVYGDEHRWRDIATWNDIKAPYTLTVGQHLALKDETTLTDAQANRTLVTAWSNLKDYETVERIILSEKTEETVTVTVTAPVAVPVPMPTPTPIPVLLPAATPLPPAVEEKGTVIEAAPLPEHEEKEAPKNEVEREARWHFSVAPLISVARLHSEFADTAIKNTLNTDIDYGVDAELAFRFSEADEVMFGAGIEHMDVKRGPDGTEIEGESQNLSHFEIGLHHQINHVSGIKVAFIEDEEAFAKPTQKSAAIVPVYIPQILVGGDWWLIHHPKFGFNLNIDGLILLPARKDVFDFEMGYGAIVGFNFENEFRSGKLVYGISARYLNQSAVHVTTWQEMALAKIGWDF